MASKEAPKEEQNTPTSNSDLMTSAKTVAEAAQLACSQQTDKIDKAKVAGAAEDILEASKSYGKLDDQSGVGQYVDKAEGYLHNLHSEGGGTEKAPPKEDGSDGGAKEEEAASGGGGGGGVGDMLNVAKKGLGGFFG